MFFTKGNHYLLKSTINLLLESLNQITDRLFVMCGGIEYQGQKVFFPQPGARLPVRLRDGNVTWVTWVRREKEAIGKFPNGGWARLSSIKNGKWKPWHPIFVTFRAYHFQEFIFH